MSEPRQALDAILRKHREHLDQAVQALEADLQRHGETVREDGTGDETYQSFVMDVSFDADYDLKCQIQAFFTTWIRDN